MENDKKKISGRAIILFFIVYLVRLSIIPVFIVFYFVAFSTETLYNSSDSAFFISFVINIVAWVFASVALAKMAHSGYRYTLTDTYFMKESGLFKKRSITIPYEAIKHVDTEQSIPERLLGLTKIYISTEGAAHRESEGYVLGLTKTEAENLRTELTRRSHEAHS